MEIFNRVEVSLSNVSKLKKKQPSRQISFSGKEAASSSSAIESMAKAKISLDNACTKPISYEERIGILKDRKIYEKDFHIFLSADDDTFKSMIGHVDVGLSVDDIKSVYDDYWGNKSIKKAAELAKFNIPFHFAKDMYSYSSIPKERIEFLKQAKFDFSQNRENFKLDEYRLKRVLENDESFARLNNLYQRGIHPNIALASTEIRAEEYQELSKQLDENKSFSPSATAAYFLSRFTDDDKKNIINFSKRNKLDVNDYEFWINVRKYRDIQRTGELLKLGVPTEALQTSIPLNDEEISDALLSSAEYKLPANDTLQIYQYSRNHEDKRKRACELARDNKMEPYIAYQLSQYDKKVTDNAIDYLSRGLDFNNALRLATMEKDDEYKEKVLSLLDTFKYVYEAEQFLNMELSEEESAKALGLIQKGANVYFAKFCLDKPTVYEKAISVLESGACKSLDGLYGGWEEEALKHLDYVEMGVPADYVSIFSGTATPDEIDLLKKGVIFEALKPLKQYEESGEDSSTIREYLTKGISFKTALNLDDRWSYSDIPHDVVMDNIYPSLDEYKILTLAKLQDERGNDWINQEEKEVLIEFVRVLKDTEDIDKFIDYGFINKKAMENYKEFVKRGLSAKHSNNALILSQLEFKDSAEYDRAVELLKRDTPFETLLYSFKDDKSFINAVNEKKKDEFYVNRITLNSHLIEFYNAGLSFEDINKISENCAYSSEDSFADIMKYFNKGHSIDDAIKIAEYCVYNKFRDEDSEKTAQRRELISDLVLKGCHFDFLRSIFYDKKKIEMLNGLLESGIAPKLAEKLALCKISPDNSEKFAKIKEIDASTINEDLKKASGNPTLYPFIDELYNFDNYNDYQLGRIIKSNISLQDISASAKVLIKSPLKQAMKRPNLYLSNIPQEDTEKVNGQYPKLTPEKTVEYQKQMLEFFKSNIVDITRALKYLDIDTFNQLMDKRTNLFAQQLEMLNQMDDKHYKLVSQITKCRKTDGKLLSSKEKIDLAKIVLYHQLGYIDISYLEEIVKGGTVDVENLNKMIFEKLMDTIGITPEEAELHSDKLNFDEEYMYLLLRTQKSADFMLIKELLDDKEKMGETISAMEELLTNPEELAHNGFTKETAIALIDLLKRSDRMEEKEIYKEYVQISPFATVDITAQDIARTAILKNFSDYILDETTPIGQVNARTKEKFEKLGINYDKWINYEKEDSIDFNGHSFNIKMWERNPQKDLFMGNRTSCCTAIIDGANGKATPIYLSNTAFNVIEMTDSNGDIVAMSRVFVAQVDDKPSLIIENIEINNAFLKNKSEEDLAKLRDKMFGYVKNLSSEITDSKGMNIYFSKNYTHVPLDKFSVETKTVDFVGDISSETVYLNCKPGWTSAENLKKEPCQLYDISKKKETEQTNMGFQCF